MSQPVWHSSIDNAATGHDYPTTDFSHPAGTPQIQWKWALQTCNDTPEHSHFHDIHQCNQVRWPLPSHGMLSMPANAWHRQAS
eukprot:354622-Chlamydomonas_euryale.AAC.3